MTEKRFDSIYYEDFCRVITDNGREINPRQVVELLNELHEENERFKKRVKELELLNDGLNYVLQNIRKIDVEIDVGDKND